MGGLVTLLMSMPVASGDGETLVVEVGSGSAAPAGVGFVVDATHIVTCAHVVNTALGRDQRAQEHPGPMARIQVDFPMLGDTAGAPSRSCAVQAWVPPPASGVSGGDVAGLVVVGEGLPALAGPARLADPAALRDVAAGVFGFPGNPPRQVNSVFAVAFSPDGTWVAGGCYRGGVRVFDASTGTELARLDHDDAVYAVVFSPGRRPDRDRQHGRQRTALVHRPRPADRTGSEPTDQKPHGEGMEALFRRRAVPENAARPAVGFVLSPGGSDARPGRSRLIA
jgi:hypothetical protein